MKKIPKWIYVIIILFCVYVFRAFGFPIQVVIPDGFSGVIEIIQDAKWGQQVPLVGFTYRVIVPDTGVLRVKSLSPWNHYHKDTAIYSSGKTLRVVSTTEPSPNIPVLYICGGGEIYKDEGRMVNINYFQYFLGMNLKISQI